MKRPLFIFAAMILIFWGCSKENELKKSVFISDKEFTDLPSYSEWGYNTFGAYYDRLPFISNNSSVPTKVIVLDTAMSFVLGGQLQAGNQYYEDNLHEMSITFNIAGFAPQQYPALIVLNDTILDLKNPEYQVIVSDGTMKYNTTILSGELNFKRAQNLLVDKKQIEVILSGYFEFKALIGGKPVTVSDGRFDVGISQDNFYMY